MSQTVHLEVFYPHPPERVWQVLTNRRALAAWMMENDFEPKLGHQFQFYSQPIPGFKTVIQCEVVELEEPNRLVYTWRESPTAEPSLVVWTLTTVAGGTQLQLRHHQRHYATAAAGSPRSGESSARYAFPEAVLSHDRTSLNRYRDFAPEWDPSSWRSSSTLYRSIQASTPGMSATFALPVFTEFAWEYYLHQKLPGLLTQNAFTANEFTDAKALVG